MAIVIHALIAVLALASPGAAQSTRFEAIAPEQAGRANALGTTDEMSTRNVIVQVGPAAADKDRGSP